MLDPEPAAPSRPGPALDARSVHPVDAVTAEAGPSPLPAGAAAATSFDAFLSYSHRDDRDLARSLERTLQTFGRRWYQLRGVRTYRDETNLAAEPDLWPAIEKAVRRSHRLVLLASPASARSEWVPKEVAAAVAARGLEGLCVVQTAGVLPWTDKVPPDALFERDDGAIAEPVWRRFAEAAWQPLVVDLRPFRDLPERERRKHPEYLSKVASIAAFALNKDKDAIWGDYHRAQRLRAAFLTVTSLALLVLVAALTLAVRRERAATELAEDKTRQSLFSLARSKASELAARSRSASPDRPDLSVALAMQSLTAMRDYGIVAAEGEQALRGALAATRGERLFCQPELAGQFVAETAAVAISPDGALLAAGTSAGVLCIYQRSPRGELTLLDALQSFGGDKLTDVRFSSRGDWLFTRTRDGSLRGLDLQHTVLDPKRPRFSDNNHAFDSFGSHDQVGPIAFDTAGSRLALYSPATSTVELWNLSTFSSSAGPSRSWPVARPVVALGLSPGGRYIAALVKVSSSEAQSLEARIEGRDRGPFSVLLWPTDHGAGTMLEHVLEHVEDRLDDDFGRVLVRGLVRIDDQARWVVAGVAVMDVHAAESQLAAELWRVRDGHGTRVQRYGGGCAPHPGSPYCTGDTTAGWTRISDANLSADGRWLYVVHDISIRLWSLTGDHESAREVATLSAPGVASGSRTSAGVIHATALSPDSKLLATTDSNGSLTLWELRAPVTTALPPSFQVVARDPLLSSGASVAFSPDATMVAMGAEHGGLQLCQVSTRCGPVEPSTTMAPRDEGQWIDWTEAPGMAWIAAISESRRVHFFHRDDWGHSFHVTDVLSAPINAPIATREYVIVSGIPGHRIAVVPSGDARWAAAFERDQYGFNARLKLIKLYGTPAEATLESAALGCKHFTGVTFDPRGQLVIAWSNIPTENCASIVRLPPADGTSAVPLDIAPLAAFAGGAVEFTPDGRLAFVRDAGYQGTSAVWLRSPRNELTALLTSEPKARPRVLDVDPRGELVVVQDASGRVYASPADAASFDGPRRTEVGSYTQHVTARFSPHGEWLVLADRPEPSSDLIVHARARSAFGARGGQWQLPRFEGVVEITFDHAGHRAVVGARSLTVDVFAPPRSYRALLLHLDTVPPSARPLDVPIDDSQESNLIDMTLAFSPDDRWLASGDRLQLWRLPGAERVPSQGTGYPVFSEDSTWLAVVGEGGTRLWTLRAGSAEDRGIVGPSGSVAFSADGRSLAILARGAIARYSLDVERVIDNAARAIGRNLTALDWSQEFAPAPYERVFRGLPVDVSFIDGLIRDAKRAHEDADQAGVERALQAATRHAVESKSVHACLAVARSGIELGAAKAVLPAADSAVQILNNAFWVRDMRGMARAAAGDLASAADDFQFVVEHGRDRAKVEQRRDWVRRLKLGQPIPDAELENSAR